ncbi:protein SCO1 homolog 1, mitochondrial-like, partial [Hibiscus syriacus]|uniref:protein SCO1 homolog 1, mitochondrial-like n=1 Tax=Hibiscus syriacus TaxID=106335 RepID=UPI0019233FE3
METSECLMAQANPQQLISPERLPNHQVGFSATKTQATVLDPEDNPTNHNMSNPDEMKKIDNEIPKNLKNWCRATFKGTRGQSSYNEMDASELVMVPDLVLPPKFKMPDFEKYLSNTTTTPNENKEKSSSSSKTDSEGTQNTGVSLQSCGSGAGKPIRGTVFHFSFWLLLVVFLHSCIFWLKTLRFAAAEISNASKAVKEGPTAGKAAIGGPFSLINDEGKRVTEKDFMGKWSLIYFGFTHCPDICPDELQKLTAAIDKIKEKAGIEILPVFISVDPKRDTVEQVHEYVNEFHPKLVGLTGSTDEIKKVARAYRVYYMKTAEVDHSIVMYLMDPNMEFVKFLGKNNDVDSLTNGVIKEKNKKHR